MWSLTIDCRCDTCIEGITRYQWPRIIAVQAPPRSAAELRKLAIAMTRRIAASPALKRKNFTPASRETKTSVKMIPRARWLRKRKRTTLPGCESLVDLRPVDDVPPRVDIVGTAVLVLQIVRVLP